MFSFLLLALIVTGTLGHGHHGGFEFGKSRGGDDDILQELRRMGDDIATIREGVDELRNEMRSLVGKHVDSEAQKALSLFGATGWSGSASGKAPMSETLSHFNFNDVVRHVAKTAGEVKATGAMVTGPDGKQLSTSDPKYQKIVNRMKAMGISSMFKN